MAASAVMMMVVMAVMRAMVMAAVGSILTGEGERQLVNGATATARGLRRELGERGSTRFGESGDHKTLPPMNSLKRIINSRDGHSVTSM